MSRRLGVAAAFALVAAFIAADGGRAQGLREATARTEAADSDSAAVVPPAPWRAVVGEVVLGTALAAGAGYGVGLLAETFCDDCDASSPGGDAPGLALGVPAGAFLGVWLVGRAFPPSGGLTDTLMGALAGAAVFAGYASLLEGESDLVRWAGAAAPGAITAMAWNRSRSAGDPAVAVGGGRGTVPQAAFRVALLELRF